MVRIGVLETGSPPTSLLSRFGSYGDMVSSLLGQSYAYARFDVRRGAYPADARGCEVYLVTGSAASVYDREPWIDRLKDFLREVAGNSVLVGICFGHQVMAEAFGGRVMRSARGWGIGLHVYDVEHRADWRDDASTIAIAASHQDQVIEPPPDAQVWAASAFTPFAALLYPRLRAISFQGHPEFTPEYAAALIETRRGAIYTDAQADEAIASLRAPNDNERVAGWIRNYISTSIGVDRELK